MAKDAVAEQIAQLRAVAENPLVRPSLRVEARKALKALLPPASRRVITEPNGRGFPAEPRTGRRRASAYRPRRARKIAIAPTPTAISARLAGSGI